MVNAFDNTCVWLCQTPEYLQWSDQQSGSFWIKGHPGVGKSMLMKHISRHAMGDKRIIVASYFFHARGVTVQHSILGMFRSLLHQLMAQIPDLCSKITCIFHAKRRYHISYIDWEWSQDDIQETFLTCVMEAAKAYRIQIYIDALDESGEQADHIIDCFRGVANSLCVCFSCRHDPRIASENEPEVFVEQNNAKDIETYLRHQIDELHFRDQILKKASGNFLWVNRVTDQAIQNKTTSLPIGLSNLYELSLSNIDGSDLEQSLKLFQWICFALRPLSLQELRIAMTVDADTSHLSFHECQESELYIEKDEAMIERVRDLSQGLAEIPKYTKFSNGEKQVWYGHVQVIHQTVHDFLLERGLETLHESRNRGLSGTLTGWSHFRLSRSCIQYLSMSEVYKLSLVLDADRLFDRVLPPEKVNQIAHEKYPFLFYATEFWFQHAELAERENISQDDLLSYFVFNSRSPTSLFFTWREIFHTPFVNDCMPDHEFRGRGPSLVHYACKSGLLSVLKGAVSQGIEMDFRSNYEKPLVWAVWGRQEAVVKWLLDRGKVRPDSNHSGVDEALAVAATVGHEAIVRMLLQQHDMTTESGSSIVRRPLNEAARHGHESIVRMLLQQHDMTTESGSSIVYYPLTQAAQHGHESIVRLLLQRDNVAADSRSSSLQTALGSAALFGHEAVVKLLLEETDVPADFRSSGGYTPLATAACRGNEAVVKLLLERDDVNVNSRTSDTDIVAPHYTPLRLAAENGHEGVVRLLLEVEKVKADRDEMDVSSFVAGFSGGWTSDVDAIVKLLEAAIGPDS